MFIRTAKQSKYKAIASSEITSESLYLKRRELLAAGLLGSAAFSLPKMAVADANSASPLNFKKADASMVGRGFYTNEALTPFSDVTSYNNFYEYGTGKSDPARRAGDFLKTDPWSVKVEGAVKKPQTYQLEDFLKKFDLEERIYRLRCVEAWSMVIPWVGIPLKDVVNWLEPTSKAKYVEFETLYDQKQMPAQKSFSGLIDWPYREGLRMDEAMNDLPLLAVGLYGKMLLPQNGAPIRLVVPWKYGFKSIKSIVKIRFSETQPKTSWQSIAPNEYGFYANVNPEVDHPRWSQASERRLPQGLFDISRRPTEMFNGYQEQVAHLYKGMDLRKLY
jgi:sulfoxide reductase catalytic subunit YedY